MKNKIISLFVLLAVMTPVTTSCSEELLDLSNPSALVSTTAYTTEDDINNALVGVYHCFYNGFFSNTGFYLLSGQSDELYSQSPDSGLVNFVNFKYPDYDRNFNLNSYRLLYQIAFRCNQVLTYMQDIEFSKYDKTSIEAQVKNMRGMAYYYLAMLWKKVPYVDWVSTPQDQPEESTFDFLCGKVEEDLLFAYKNLPAKFNDYRPNKWFTASYLGKLYMNWNHQYDKALPYFDAIVKSGQYSLTANYRDNFREDTENNCESIFEVQNEANAAFGGFFGGDNNDAVCSYNSYRQKCTTMSPAGFGDFSVYEWLIDAYKEEKNNDGGYDLRLRDNIFYEQMFEDFPGEIIWTDTNTWNTAAWQHLAYIRKYTYDYDRNIRAITFFNGINTRILRYGEILMCYAECLAQTGNLAEAVKQVDIVRARANMPGLADSTNERIRDCVTSKDKFMAQLDLEKVKECCFEYDRFIDLRRWGLGTDQTFTNKVKARAQKYADNFTNGKEWMPIPRSEVDNNPNLTQNDGF